MSSGGALIESRYGKRRLRHRWLQRGRCSENLGMLHEDFQRGVVSKGTMTGKGDVGLGSCKFKVSSKRS